MATLTIRNLPDEVHRRLRIRAAENGRSMEAEARAILSEGCSRPRARTAEEREAAMQRLQAFVDKLYAGKKPKSTVDELIPDRPREAEREASE